MTSYHIPPLCEEDESYENDALHWFRRRFFSSRMIRLIFKSIRHDPQVVGIEQSHST